MRLPASGRVVCGRRVAGVTDFMAASFAPDGPSWPVGEVASPLMLWARRWYCCGLGGRRWGVFFFSGFVDDSNMRLVPGGACLVGVAHHQWNKVLQVFLQLVFLQLVAIYSSGGGGPVKFELLGSVAPAGASEGVGSCTGVWGRHLLAMSSWLWDCAVSSLSAAVVRVAAAGQVEARGRTSNKDPTADDRVSRISCSNPRLGVRSLFWRATVRGLLLQESYG